MRALSRARIQWSGDKVIKITTDSDQEYARFGMDQDQIGDQACLDSFPRVRGMRRPPGMRVGELKFNPSTSSNSDISKR